MSNVNFSNDRILFSNGLVKLIDEDVDLSIAGALFLNGYIYCRRADLMDDANMLLMGGEMG